MNGSPSDIPVDLQAALADRYVLRRVLGRGGMATVYLADDKKHYRAVALKVLLPGLDAKQTPVSQVMTGNPVTVKPDDPLQGCMAMMAARGFRHLPVLDAGKVVGVISIGDVVKDIIRNLEHNVGDLMGYIMTDGPGG